VRLQLNIRQGRRQHAAQHAAFADLHREHAIGVYNLAVRLVGDREQARDISQDVLLKAFERLGKPGELNQRAWLYRVTVNACYDHLRAVRRRPCAAEGWPEPVSKVDGFEQAELVRAVEATLRRLPPAQRAALLLREVHGLPTGEVAFALGTQPDSAAVTLSRARRAFRRHFAALHGPDDGSAPAAAWRATAAAGTKAKAGALVLGLWLPRLHLPQTPLPAELESARMLSATSAVANISAGHGGEATFGILARLADALCTKAGAVGASATLITGSIGGAYAIENGVRSPRTVPVAVSRQAAAPANAKDGASSAPISRPATSAAASASPSAAPTSSGSPAPTASPLATPSGTPTPLTLGETAPTASPSPEPSPTAEPSATATPVPAPSDEPTPSPSPTPQTSPAP
jgi:RNA polymerase sigma-70 factor (ECF subfamily)